MTDKEKLEKLVAYLVRRMYAHNQMADIGSTGEIFDEKIENAKYEECRDTLNFIDSMQKEPKDCMYSKDNYTDEDKKVLCGGCKTECEFNKKEEPVSEDLEQEINAEWNCYSKDGQVGCINIFSFELIARHFANWQKEQMEAYRIEHCKSLTNEQAELEDNFVSSHVEKNNRIPTFIDAIEYGIEYGKQQVIAKAFDVEIDSSRSDGKRILSGNFFKFNTGDRAKVIVIKEG